MAPLAKPEKNYGLFILLPLRLDRQLETWTRATPGATWPEWRGHITLLNSFTPKVSRKKLLASLLEVCQTNASFDINLDRVSRQRHLVRENLETVMLVESQPDTSAGLYELRSTLLANLRRIKEDGDITRKVAARPYLPHLSLTMGLPQEDARALAKSARDAELSAQFQVDRVHLVSFEASKTPRVRGVLRLADT